MADAEAMQKENGGDNYNMKVTFITVTYFVSGANDYPIKFYYYFYY